MAAKNPSDIDTYLATFPADDHQELAHADLALDLVVLAQRVTDDEATWLDGLRQAIARLDRAGERLDLAMLEKYLNELGYSFRLMSVAPIPLDRQP